jgi:hypothetical protein
VAVAYDDIGEGEFVTDSLVYKYGLGRVYARTPIAEIKAECLELFSASFGRDSVLAELELLEKNQAGIYLMTDPSASVDERRRSNAFRWYAGTRDPSPCWDAYRQSLELRMETGSIESIDRSSDRILSLCDSPGGEEDYATRGLVLGYVQSGKTTNFGAVMAKAGDNGFNLFIVLSGVTNSLRNQTQVRLRETLGFVEPSKWHWLTDVDIDFNAHGINASQLLGNTSINVVAVVKKNSGRLSRLLRWLESASPAVRQGVNMMIIDDEADQASVNTKKARHMRTAVNARLIKILELMPRTVYIGYSATPFANLLMDPDDAGGLGLYPRDFIVSLSKGDGYFGPEELFGRDPIDEDDQAHSEGADIIRSIPDTDRGELGIAFNPTSPNLVTVTDALRQAVDWFVIATCVRRLRERSAHFSTMLVHASARIQSHQAMALALEESLASWKAIGAASRDTELALLWESERFRAGYLTDEQIPEWSEINPLVPAVLDAIRVVVDNSASTDRLDYSEKDAIDLDPVIVVGGNTLARGLTLEGLVSTYFMRTSSAYDSLLQMGRWFGYRRKYEDLQRIWMTDDLAGWFRDLALVEEEIRQAIARYEEDEVTPLDMPVLIRTHPAMSVTSPARMRDAIPGQIGFSGDRVETILFPTEDLAWLEDNLGAGRALVGRMLQVGYPIREKPSGTRIFEGVTWEEIREFLHEYRFFSKSAAVDPALIEKYVDLVRNQGELNYWNVFLFSRDTPMAGSEAFDFGSGIKVNKVSRSRIHPPQPTHSNIHHLVSKYDALIDIPDGFEQEISDVKSAKCTLAHLEKLRSETARLGKVGLIGLYIIEADSKAGGRGGRADLNAAADVLGVGLFFPKSSNPGNAIDYVSAPPAEILPEHLFDEQLDDLHEETDAI